MTDARHHLHKRKRIHEHHEIYPHPQPWKRYLDYGVYVMGVCAPLMTFFQVFEIWVKKSAGDISPATWITYFLSSIIWLLYGLAHKEKAIIISNALYVIATALVLLGIVYY